MSLDREQKSPGPTRGPSRRRWLAWLGSGVLVLLLALTLKGLIVSQSAVPSREEQAPPTEAAAQVGAPPPSPSSPAPPPGRPGVPPAPPDDPIADYRERTRYSPHSGVLHASAIDLLEPNRRYESFRPIGDTADRGAQGMVSFLFDADHYFYEGDDVVTATLSVRRGGALAPVTITRGRALAEGASGVVGDGEDLVFRARGGKYQTELRLEDLFPTHHGPIQLSVEFEYEPGKLQDAGLRIFSTPVNAIPARFAGRYSDVLVNGSLVVGAGVEVGTPGFYRFDANLFSSAGAPLAFASFKGQLEAGWQWVPLEFFGLLLLDLGSPGPYELRNLRGYLFLDGAYPDRLRMRDAEGSYWTGAYEVSSFSEEEYMTPHKARMLELLEQDLRADIAVDKPGPAGEL